MFSGSLEAQTTCIIQTLYIHIDCEYWGAKVCFSFERLKVAFFTEAQSGIFLLRPKVAFFYCGPKWHLEPKVAFHMHENVGQRPDNYNFHYNVAQVIAQKRP